MSFKNSTLLKVVIMGLTPAVLISAVALYIASQSLTTQVFNQLESLREVKKDAVNQYLEGAINQIESLSQSEAVIHAARDLSAAFYDESEIKRHDDEKTSLEDYYQTVFIPELKKKDPHNPDVTASDLTSHLSPVATHLQMQYIVNNSNALDKKQYLNRAKGHSQYHEIHQEIHPFLRDYLERFGYYDIFVIDKQGNVIYSVFKEIDFASSLTKGPSVNGGLAKAYQKVKATAATPKAQLVDFHRYLPSYNSPAGFIASPILLEGESIGALIFQFPIHRLNEIMSQRAGLGETGETYLVGSDGLMRSDSYLDPDSHSVEASFLYPDTGSIATEAFERGLSGESGIGIITDYNGQPVFSAFAPLGFRDLNWIILTEMDEAEALAPVSHLRTLLFWIVGIGGLLVFCSAWRLCDSILKPLGGDPKEISTIALGIAEGNLQFGFKSSCDTSSIYGAMKTMNANLKSLISEIGSAAEQQTAAAEQLTAITQCTSNSIEAQSQKTTLVATAVVEMNAAAKEVSKNTDSTASSAQCAREQVNTSVQEVIRNSDNMRKMADTLNGGQEKIEQLRTNTDAIVDIVQTITGIADQTNLLALNAAIEAARAGEQGRGFTVVSEEVRNLAGHTQKSTEKISTMIDALLNAAEQAGKVMDYSVELAMSISTDSSSTAERLQAAAVAVEEITQKSEQIASASNQQSVTAEDIGNSIHEVSNMTSESTESVTQIASASEELSQLSNRLQQSVMQFKL